MTFNPTDTPAGKWMKISIPYRATCCDCGLTHEIEVRADPDSPGEFELRVGRDEMMTRAARRSGNHVAKPYG